MMNHSYIRPFFLRVLLMLLVWGGAAGAWNVGAVRAQALLGDGLTGRAPQPVQWTTTVAPNPVAPGGTTHVGFRATIGDGWKMYALDAPPPAQAVTVHFDSLAAGLTQTGTVRQQPPQRGYDPYFAKDVSYFTKEAVLEADLAVSDTAAVGTRAVQGTITYMVCNDRMCLPPTDHAFTATVQVARDAPTSAKPLLSASGLAPAASGGGITLMSGLEAARSGGFWGFLLLAIGAGAAALLTPCVFPMIPLTVSYFTKHADSRGEAARMAGVYGLSIVAIFTGLGVAMAAVLGAGGAQTVAANPWVNLFIGAIFVLFALSLLGLFELRLPSALINYVNRQGNTRTGYVGVFFMGLTLALVSFTCTVPFVGGLLAATAGGAWIYPIAGMLVFSATFALPFVAFALFPRGLQALPKSGSWMNAVKVTLGFVELAAAIKFLSNADLIWGWNVLSRPLAIALVVVIFALAGLYLLGKLRLKHEPAAPAIGSLRLLAAMAFFGVALYMVPGLFGAQLGALDAYLPPRRASDPSFVSASRTDTASADHAALNWHTDDIDAALTAAAAQDKPVFVDFTGYTCTNCRAMEANVFTKPAVARRFEQDFVLLRLYTDGQPHGPRFQRYQLRLTGTTALPTYAILAPDGETVIDRVSGTLSAEAFLRFLRAGTPDPQLAAR